MEHLMAWVAREYEGREDEAMRVADMILSFTREYPDVAARHTYREVLDICERNAAMGIGR
jgi:hypothetical protein